MTNSEESNDFYQSGHEAGYRWAQPIPDSVQVQRIVREFGPPRDESPLEFLDIMSVIDPGSEQDPDAAREYWQQIANHGGSDIFEPEFLSGFIDGVIEATEHSADAESPEEDFDDDDESFVESDSEEDRQDEESPAESNFKDPESGREFRSVDIDGTNADDET